MLDSFLSCFPASLLVLAAFCLFLVFLLCCWFCCVFPCFASLLSIFRSAAVFLSSFYFSLIIDNSQRLKPTLSEETSNRRFTKVQADTVGQEQARVWFQDCFYRSILGSKICCQFFLWFRMVISFRLFNSMFSQAVSFT